MMSFWIMQDSDITPPSCFARGLSIVFYGEVFLECFTKSWWGFLSQFIANLRFKNVIVKNNTRDQLASNEVVFFLTT